MKNQNSTIVETGWADKETASDLLGVSPRQLENLASQGRIQKQRLQRQPNERSARVLYLIADIEAIKTQRANLTAQPNGRTQAAAPATVPVERTPAKREPIPTDPTPADPFAGLAPILAKLASEHHQLSPKPWLTASEAAAYSGLPRTWLITHARSGHLQAVNVSGGKQERWMFNRIGLSNPTCQQGGE